MKNRGRGNQRNDYGNGHGGNRPRRPPLEWQVIKTFDFGNVRAIISRALLDNGDSRYSFKIGKVDPKDPERCKPFIDSRDIDDTDKALEAIESFIEECRA